ncbi:MAG: Gfo/Idh/MocA family oxidoreductase [Deltaproteobacteria bacterium]|nr:Gfo/Idh/MocA family oxidoreductase [Deltaproteobacteria bacterium]
MSRLKVAVIGAGDIAAKHLEVLTALDGTEIVALCNRGHPRIYGLAERFNIRQVFTDCRRMWNETSVDAVLVLASVANAVEVAGDCLGRGIPTLLEKPPGLSVPEARGLLDIASATHCLNMVGLNRRFYSVMQRAREAILEVGPLVSVVVEAPERLAEVKAWSHPDEVIRRLLFFNGIHCIDLLRYFGGDVGEVHACSSRWFEDQKDSFGAVMRFKSGAMGHYIANWMSPGRWTVNLYGKGRRVTIAPLEQGVIVDGDGEERPIQVSEVDVRFKAGLYAQDRYFLDCVRNGRRVAYPAADLADAVKTMELIEAIGGDVA